MDWVFSFLLWPKRGALGPWKQGRKKRGSIARLTNRTNEANKMFFIWLCWLFHFWKSDRELEVRTATYESGIDQLWQRKRAQRCDSSGSDSAEITICTLVWQWWQLTMLRQRCQLPLLSQWCAHRCHTNVNIAVTALSVVTAVTLVCTVYVTPLSQYCRYHRCYTTSNCHCCDISVDSGMTVVQTSTAVSPLWDSSCVTLHLWKFSSSGDELYLPITPVLRSLF